MHSYQKRHRESAASHDSSPAPVPKRTVANDQAVQCRFSAPAQKKPVVGQGNDKYEREADQVADRIVSLGNPGNIRYGDQGAIRRKEASGATRASTLPPSLNSGGGRPLDRSSRHYFESRFGHDFSQVRIHDNTQADVAAKSIHAKAFTYGSDISFGSGHYQPSSSEGRKLLAHELTHVVQQQGTSPMVQRAPEDCKVEVAANRLGWLPFFGNYYHLHIRYTDQDGNVFFLRGGPNAGGPGSSGISSEMSGGSSRGSSEGSSGSGSNSSRSSDSGGGGPWGTIVTTSGAYLPGTIDWDPGAPTVTIEHGATACPRYGQMQTEINRIQNQNIRYNPLGPNSNSVVYTTLRRVGLNPAVPNGVWAPGRNSRL